MRCHSHYLCCLLGNRAVFTKAQVQKGDHILITGIGGGVALFALQFAVAAGANVYVSSSSADKINKAVALGAKGGINYKDRKSAVPGNGKRIYWLQGK